MPSKLAAVGQVHRLGEVLEHLVAQALKRSKQLEVILQIYRLNRRQNREQVRLERVLVLAFFERDDELALERARWVSK